MCDTPKTLSVSQHCVITIRYCITMRLSYISLHLRGLHAWPMDSTQFFHIYSNSIWGVRKQSTHNVHINCFSCFNSNFDKTWKFLSPHIVVLHTDINSMSKNDSLTNLIYWQPWYARDPNKFWIHSNNLILLQ